MSGFIGVFGSLDAGDRARRAADHLTRRGQGPVRTLARDQDALALLDFGPSIRRLEHGDLWIAWDGRLDQPAQLADRIGEPFDSPSVLAVEGEPAARLVIEAYRQWGEGFADSLRGDFALGIFDSKARRLLLTRDAIGARPLFYCVAGKTAFCASTLEAILAAADLDRRLAPQWVASYLTRSPSSHHTPFSSVKAVEPGRTVLVENGKVEHRRWFHLGANEDLSKIDDPEAELRFLEAFRTAVGRRMMGELVGIDLSGGLDSSSIAAVADDLARQGTVDATPVTASFLYRKSRTADEMSFIGVMEEFTGRESIHIEQDDYPIFQDFDRPFFEVPGMKICLRAREEALVQELRRRGARVQLRGVGGDHLLISEVGIPYHLADLLRQGRLGAMAAHASELARGQGRAIGGLLWTGLVETSLPLGLRARLQNRRKDLPSWLRPSWCRKVDLDSQLFWERRVADAGPPSMKDRVAQLQHAVHVASWAYDRGPTAMDVAYPYLDRDLIQLCLNLPYGQFVRGGETRSILRRALKTSLPPAVLERRGKASPHEAYARALGNAWPTLDALLSNLRLAELGIVEPGPLRKSLEAMRFGMPTEPMALQVLGLEMWIRSQPQLIGEEKAP